MIKKINLFLCLILVITVKGGDIETAVNKILPPGMEVQAIADSTIDGIKVVDIGELQPIYVTEDGKYFFYGELYSIDESNINNLTDEAKQEKRANLISSNLSSADFITFPAQRAKHEITVFTDVDCGYCRKFHSEIADYNEIGITVNYVAFPRSGPDSSSYNKQSLFVRVKPSRIGVIVVDATPILQILFLCILWKPGSSSSEAPGLLTNTESRPKRAV